MILFHYQLDMHPNLNLLENGHLKTKIVSGKDAITIRPLDAVASCSSCSCMFVFVGAREKEIDAGRDEEEK
jgi:hypothetical protein